MRKTYFPKAKFVRRLNELYAELSEYRARYATSRDWPESLSDSGRMDDRLSYLAHVQHELIELIDLFNDVPRPS
jgi:hypothetical protein